MAITRTSFLYEILLRFNANGYQGAHVIDLEQVIEDGNVISERELPARPITEAEIGTIIGAQSAALVEAADAARAEARAIRTENAQLQEILVAADISIPPAA